MDEKMDEKAKKIIIDGILKAGEVLRKHFKQDSLAEISKVTTFDYGILADKASEEILLKAIGDSGVF